MKPLLPILLLVTFSFCYVVFSYSLTAPNLILSSWPPYWNFQTQMWQTFFNNRSLLNQVFLALVTGLWLVYGAVLIVNKKWLTTLPFKPAVLLIAAVSLPFILASNALSYDIFNYLFNAKMMMVYHANPHQAVALDFADDDWVRFMHNTHTPAPYGYGWSALSLVPYSLGFGKLLSSWLSFKTFSWLSYLLLATIYWYHTDEQKRWFAWVVLLNPLILIEIIGNSHNDLWMLVPALASLVMINGKGSSITKVVSLGLLLFSISIKLASVILLPIWIFLFLKPALAKFVKNKQFISQLVFFSHQQWAWLASVGLFLPLLTERSKYFLPWYITWALVWLPFFSKPSHAFLAKVQQGWQFVLIGFTISSMYRYVPFLSQGNYDGSVISDQIVITWVGGLTIALILMACHALYRTFFRSGRMG